MRLHVGQAAPGASPSAPAGEDDEQPLSPARRRVIGALLSPARDACAQAFGGSRVLVRCDLNLPQRPDGSVSDASRLDASLPLLRSLAGGGARVIVVSHLGRPQPGREPEEDMRRRDTLQPVADLLSAALGDAFRGMADDCGGASSAALVASLRDGDACLLQNARFEPGDADDEPQLAARLAALADAFVLDGFGVCHRRAASVSGVARALPPSARFAGPLVRSELKYLAAALDAPRRPLGVVLGGAKVKDKLGVLWALIRKADVILVGGKMAFTFLAAAGVALGATQIEPDMLDEARAMTAAAADAGVQLLLPADVLCSDSLDREVNGRVVRLQPGCCSAAAPCLPPGAYGVDIGPEASSQFEEAVLRCATLLWNGPMGRFEVPSFARGTRRVLAALARAHDERGAAVVAAGGDSVAALNAAGLAGSFTHVSTGGGASLQLLEGRSMPGLEALLA